MSALEKAAAAVHSVERRKGDAFDVGDDMARDIARAVLMAVRIPESEVAEAGMIAGGFSGMADVAFTAIIDAILDDAA